MLNMKKNLFGQTKLLHNIKAAMCLRVLLILQHASPIITILYDMGKIQLMGHNIDSKENLLDLRNQEERPSELHKSYLHLQPRSWTPKSKIRANAYITGQGLGILKPSQGVP